VPGIGIYIEISKAYYSLTTSSTTPLGHPNKYSSIN